MSDQAYFRLFDLPGELVEYISFFFDASEAHELLTVSHACHDLFAKRVWWKLDSRMFTILEPTRSMAMARYGILIRRINFDHGICDAIKLDISYGGSICSILAVFSDVTTLKLDLWRNSFVSNGIQYKDIIKCFPRLYKLGIVILNDSEPYDLITLALAINHRHDHSNMNCIEYLNLKYFIHSIDNPWIRLSNFVKMVLSIRVLRIEVPPLSTTTTLPCQSELQILNKYITYSPYMEIKEEAQYCYAALNRLLFWRPLTDFITSNPQPCQLSLRTCCVSLDTYDYFDITPSNFPSLQIIKIKGYECDKMISHSHPPAWKKVLMQRWPYLNGLTLLVDMTCKQLVTILENNCRLTRLDINLQPKMLDENNAFNLASILPLLPRLQRLYIYGNNTTKLDYHPGIEEYDILARSQINIALFKGLYLSSRIFTFLYSLPKLGMQCIYRCKFYTTGVTEVTEMNNLINDSNSMDNDGEDDEGDDGLYEELMTTLSKISMRLSVSNQCVIRVFNIHSSEEDGWPIDFTVEMIALMPELRSFNLGGEAGEIPNAVKARFPYINIKTGLNI
ncbi:hypothetical protein GQ42DRAFT_162024 [Ramicandelaber brevisporus]|nr:hypothetical protein GQ42DRAFT_162024 [Ramicandelaber brevisporus]